MSVPPVKAGKPLLECISNRHSPGNCSGPISPPPSPISKRITSCHAANACFFHIVSPPLYRRSYKSFVGCLPRRQPGELPCPFPNQTLRCWGNRHSLFALRFKPSEIAVLYQMIMVHRGMGGLYGWYPCINKYVDYSLDKPTCHPWPDFRAHCKINATPRYVHPPCYPGACPIPTSFKSVRRDVTSGQSAGAIRSQACPRPFPLNSYDGIE